MFQRGLDFNVQLQCVFNTIYMEASAFLPANRRGLLRVVVASCVHLGRPMLGLRHYSLSGKV